MASLVASINYEKGMESLEKMHGVLNILESTRIQIQKMKNEENSTEKEEIQETPIEITVKL